MGAREIQKLISAEKKVGRHGNRDAIMILIAFRHGLRVSELVSIKWLQIDLKQGLFHVTRRKNGINCTHPLFGPEIRALRKLKRDYPDTQYAFITERKGPITDSTFLKILSRAGEKCQHWNTYTPAHALRACFKIHVPLILYFFIFSHQTFGSEIWSGCSYLNLAYKNFHIGL